MLCGDYGEPVGAGNLADPAKGGITACKNPKCSEQTSERQANAMNGPMVSCFKLAAVLAVLTLFCRPVLTSRLMSSMTSATAFGAGSDFKGTAPADDGALLRSRPRSKRVIADDR
jgi:hypothetical protein